MDNKNIIIDFSRFPFCFRCVSVDDFTNKLKDCDEFFYYFKRLIETEIPALTQFTFDNVTKMTRHSHSILYKSKEYDKVIKIVKKLYSEFKNDMLTDHDFELFYDNHINEYQMWQLGITSGIRLIGIRYNNIFSVLFIDYHHLIYPDKNYNQDNYELYSFCPIENNN